MNRTRRTLRGMTLVEVMITLSVMAVALGGFSMVVLSTQKASLDMRQRDMVRAQAMKYMERLLRLPFGTAADPPATAAQVRELFDDNAVLVGGSSLTLTSLATPVNAEGWRFRVEGFETAGVFEVEINSDLDGNGTDRGVRGTETPTTGAAGAQAGDGVTVVNLRSEGDRNLLRVEIFFNGESVLRTVRSAPVEGT